jgi:SGNH hydrolase-like domain, acetyltransferase AlgX
LTALRALLSRFLLIVLGILIPLLLLEGAIRMLDIAPPASVRPPLWAPHPYLGWFHVPNRGGVFYSEYGEFRADVHINARGLRDREIGYDNTDGAYRILVLGDSFAEALQVPLEATFIKQLEQQLSRPDRPVEVINGGVGGWGTDQEAIFYAIEGFRYQPDVVLLCFFPHNDVLNNYQPLEVGRIGEIQKPFFHLENGQLVAPTLPFEPPPSRAATPTPWLPVGEWLNGHLALYRLVTPYAREVPFLVQTLGPTGLLGGMAVSIASDAQPALSYEVYRTTPTAAWQEAWQLTDAIIQRLDSEVRSHGGQLATVIIGTPEQVYPARWSAALSRYPALRGQDVQMDVPNRRLAGILDQANIPYLDLLPVFRAEASLSSSPPLYYRHDGHWTPIGHMLAARSIAAFLDQAGLLPE